MKTLLITILILIIATILLAATKPSETDFRKYINKHMKVEKKESLATQILGKALEAQIKMTVSYEDRFIFSTAEFTAYDQKITYLGIAGSWIPLHTEK